MNRFVIDASTLVPGASPHAGSPPSPLFNELTEAQFELVVCPRLLAEVCRALRKPYFKDRVGDREADEIVGAIEDAPLVREDPAAVEAILRDPGDDYLVALAQQAAATAIVTSDNDLLEHPGLEPAAITPWEACERLGLIAKQAD